MHHARTGAPTQKMDMFVLAHIVGWWGKAVILRDVYLCQIISVSFELMEYVLSYMLPNFQECWWDHVRCMRVPAARSASHRRHRIRRH